MEILYFIENQFPLRIEQKLDLYIRADQEIVGRILNHRLDG
jgi:hypothetical protein